MIKRSQRNATPIHIHTPLYGYYQKFGTPKETIYVGLNKIMVDDRAEKKGLIDLTIGDGQTKAILASEIQKCPIEFVKNSQTQVYIYKVN